MNHLELVEQAKVSISSVFGDKSVSKKETMDSLLELEEYIQDCIVPLQHDIDKEEE